MPSRRSTMEAVDQEEQQEEQQEEEQEEEQVEEQVDDLMRRRGQDGRLGTRRNRSTETPELSKRDLLHLLGIMEGEVQAREDIIGLLQGERRGAEVLESRYGSAAPFRPLQALQRDQLLLHGDQGNQGVYQKPMAELERLQDKQKETYRRMLEQLLMVEKCHRTTVTQLDNEKRKHIDFMNKSDDFTNLLEQDRERLKRILEQQKVYQARKNQDHGRRLEQVQAELVKLKTFALMLVDERQVHVEQIEQHSQKIQDLTQKLQEKEDRLTAASSAAQDHDQKFLRLEAELEHRAAKFSQEHDEMRAKLADQESQSRQLRLKLGGLSRKMEEVEENNKTLQKSEEDLQELRKKISNGETTALVAELENLRKKVREMEGKDEEITKSEGQCRDLKKKLQDEENRSKELRLEVDHIQKRMVDLEKLEDVFNKSKGDCSQLHTNLEKERQVVKELATELETLKTQLKELQSSESKLEMSEMTLKDDLMKLKSFTVILADDRKNLAQRLKQEELKGEELGGRFKTEQSKVTEVTEKLIEESKNLLKLKSEMEVQVSTLTKEKEELAQKLADEEENCQELKDKLRGMKIGLDEVEESQRELQRRWSHNDRNQDEGQKVKELTLEVETLRSRLRQLEVVEGDLMKTEDEYDLLEKKFRMEQDKANTLSKLLEEMKTQMARNKVIEKSQMLNPEAKLRLRCKLEEARSRELQLDIQTLKEKIHELMNKEDQLSQLQVDYSILQQRFMEEEEEKKTMTQEVDSLTKELEATKCYGRALRPSMNGRKMVNVPVTSTAVQTDATAREPAEDETVAGFIRKSVLEEKNLMSNLRQRFLKKPTVLERYPPAAAELAARKSCPPWMKKRGTFTLHQGSPVKTSGASLQPSSMTRKPGEPLHIRVTPGHENSSATLEITSPRAEDFFSSTTIIPMFGLQKPRITIVPKPTIEASNSKTCDLMGSLDRVKSPVTITTISRAMSPEKTTSGLQSPVSIITVSTTPVAEAGPSPDPHETASGRTVTKVTPERQPGLPQVRAYNPNSNIITTEDNTIHIHLGPPFQRPCDGGSSPLVTIRESKETTTGTVLRSPYQTSMGRSKMTSSITITPITAAAPRTTPSPANVDAPSGHGATTRIPVSSGTNPATGCKAMLGVSTVSRLESRAESRSMKIELRKSTHSPPSAGAEG